MILKKKCAGAFWNTNEKKKRKFLHGCKKEKKTFKKLKEKMACRALRREKYSS